MNVGERIGDYEIVEVLGSGGMGEVFKVRNTLSGRIEAMKVLHSNLTNDKELAERFQREIRVQAALDHPHIARLNTAQLLPNAQGTNQLIMAMEYVDGESLAQMLQRGPLNLMDCIKYSTQVLDALGYAHEHGVVHRDIKPANIMCTRQGNIKLMDFGIARMTADQKLTDTGKTVGSLHYMSPEQIRGTEPDPRSDIYSFGITLYEMVTGKKPFEGASNYSIMSAHLQQQAVPPINVSAGVPEALSQIILMAIAKDPAQRFQTAKAFSGALQSVAPGPTMSMVAPAAFAAASLAAPAAGMAPPVGPAPISALPNYPPPPMAPPSAQPMPPVTIPPVQRSMRGLYMVLGSMVTILVLAVAAFEGPKFFRAGANTHVDSAVKTNLSQPAIAPVPAAPAKETPAPAVDAVAPAPVAVPDGTKPAVAVTPAPVTPVALAPTPLAPARATNPVPAPVPVVVPPAVKTVQAPQTSAQVVPQSSPVVRPVQTTQPAPVQAPVPAVNRELGEVREQYNEMSIQASASRASLDSMAQQIQRQGLGLRRDIVEAQTRLDYQMKEAMDSIRAGDLPGAREHLRFAHGNLDVINKFLGH